MSLKEFCKLSSQVFVWLAESFDEGATVCGIDTTDVMLIVSSDTRNNLRRFEGYTTQRTWLAVENIVQLEYVGNVHQRQPVTTLPSKLYLVLLIEVMAKRLIIVV